jgi:hypothetical protein
MKSFKNYFPLFCISFLLAAVKGEVSKVSIGITITPEPPQGYKYSIHVYCWQGGKYVGSCISNDGSCSISPYKPTGKRINCEENKYSIYVHKLDDGHSSVDGVSREFGLLASLKRESLRNRNFRTFQHIILKAGFPSKSLIFMSQKNAYVFFR